MDHEKDTCLQYESWNKAECCLVQPQLTLIKWLKFFTGLGRFSNDRERALLFMLYVITYFICIIFSIILGDLNAKLASTHNTGYLFPSSNDNYFFVFLVVIDNFLETILIFGHDQVQMPMKLCFSFYCRSNF